VSTRIHDGSDELEHPFKPLRKLVRKVDSGGSPEEQAQQDAVRHRVVVPERLLAVGAIGALLSVIFWSSWGGWGPPDRRREVY
jgi:hypothetical protein